MRNARWMMWGQNLREKKNVGLAPGKRYETRQPLCLPFWLVVMGEWKCGAGPQQHSLHGRDGEHPVVCTLAAVRHREVGADGRVVTEAEAALGGLADQHSAKVDARVLHGEVRELADAQDLYGSPTVTQVCPLSLVPSIIGKIEQL